MIGGCSLITPVPVTYTITVISGNNGSITQEGNISVIAGSNLSLGVSAEEGYVIADILIDGKSILQEGESAGTVYTYIFTDIQQNHTFEAIFNKEIRPPSPAPGPTPPPVTKKFNLNMNSNPPAGGTATDITGTGPYSSGNVVTISAVANDGYEFFEWTSVPAVTFADANDANTTLTMPAENVVVTANFVLKTFTLTISIEGDGQGKTVPEELVSHTYDYGASVEIIAIPLNDCHYFTGWSEDATGTDNPTNIIIDGNKKVTANFAKRTVYNITQDTNHTTIQDAIDNAIEGDEIVVCPGTYLETINYSSKNIILRSTDPDDPNIVESTIIDGNSNGSVVTFNSNETSAAVLSGFTIRNGDTNGDGGGIYIKNCSPFITKNIIEDNYSAYGGGIYLENSDANITDNIIRNNDVSSDGGGINVYLGSPTITHNEIYGNIRGYGIYVYNATPTIGGSDSEDTDNFNTITDNYPDQIYPDSFPYNYF